MAESRGPNVLVFPFPAQGHMLPLLDLSHLLSLRGLSITIFVTPKNLPILEPLLSKSPTVQTLVLPFSDHPPIPSGIENVKDLPSSYFRLMIQAMAQFHDPLLRWAKSTPNPPSAIISDFFLGWTLNLAVDLAIPRLVFCPSGALTLSISHCMWREMPKRDDPNDPNFPLSFASVPNSPTYPWYQLSPLYRSHKEGDPLSEFVRECFLFNISSWGFVFNSFSDLEGKYLDHLRRDLGHARVRAVGPVSLLDGSAGRGGASSVPAGDLMTWLDGCEDGSVVYVCFGSQVVLSPPQVAAVAAGLEKSGARFVWCVKASTTAAGDGGVVPEEYDERVAGRGIVIRGWAPQVAVLCHRAVGSFLTHCGWNSVLEGISAGVVMLTWPMGADQYINARLLVEEAGVGVKVCEGSDGVPDSDELARVAAESVSVSRPERVRAGELGRKALEAVREGGSSYEELEALVAELKKTEFERRSDAVTNECS